MFVFNQKIMTKAQDRLTKERVMTSQVKQVFFRCDKPFYADDARAMIAQTQVLKEPAYNVVMNFQKPGLTRTAFPSIHFKGSNQGFSMLAFGAEAISVLDESVPAIHTVTADECGETIHLDSRVMNLSADRIDYMRTYTVPQMVVQKKPIHLIWLKDQEKRKEHLERLFKRSIETQARALGIKLPSFDVNFITSDRTYSAKSKRRTSVGDVSNLGLLRARFETNLKLKGIWTVGYMLSKGNGHFDPDYTPGTEVGN